jgi:WD40 repeat protein
MCLFGPARTACADETGTTDWSANPADVEQVYQRDSLVFRISWSPDAKSLVLASADGSLWIMKPPEYSDAKRLTGPIGTLDIIQWSPDGRWLLVAGERPSDKRPNYPWGTPWLVDPSGKSTRKDLLPPGSPFKTAGRRWIQNALWLDNDRVYFSMHCGTGCVGHYSINVNDGSYQIFCIGSGQIEWAPDRKVGVTENDSNGLSAQGLGLVAVNSGVAIGAGSTPYQYDRACKSVFSGGPRTDDPGEFPRFIAWLPDGRRVLYSNARDGSLRLWDTQTGQRTTLFAGHSQ